MIYACDACYFLFERTGETEQCPDCGKYRVRPANEQEIEEFKNRKKKSELPIENDTNV